jgi:amino acid permease
MGVIAVFVPPKDFTSSFSFSATMNTHSDNGEKHVPAYEPGLAEHKRDGQSGSDPENLVVEPQENKLHQDLKGRHMQMIAM